MLAHIRYKPQLGTAAGHWAGVLMEEHIAEFVRLSEAVAPALKHATFSYLAIRREGRLVIVQGRLTLNLVSQDLNASFESGDVFAGQLLLSEFGKTPEDVLRELAKGVLHVPAGELHFDKYEAGGYSWHFDQNHPGIQQGRSVLLTISGRHRDTIFDLNAVEWELRGAATPYQNIHDLLSQHRMALGSGPSLDRKSVV